LPRFQHSTGPTPSTVDGPRHGSAADAKRQTDGGGQPVTRHPAPFVAHVTELVDELRDGYFELDLQGNLTAYNPALCHMHGCAPDAMRATDLRDAMHPEALATLLRTFCNVRKTGKPAWLLHHELLRPDGSSRTVNVSVHLSCDASGQPTGFWGVVEDVTERTRQTRREQARTRALERIAGGASLPESLREVLAVLRAQIPEASAAAFEARSGRLRCVAAAGISPDALALLEAQPIAPDAGIVGRAAHAAEIKAAATLSADPELRARQAAARAAGLEAIWAAPVLSPEHKPLGALALFLPRRRTPEAHERTWLHSAATLAAVGFAHRDLMAELDYLSHYDSLTGLLNRRAFVAESARLIALAARNGWSPGLLLIDIDRFKGVNDIWGHTAGDDLLAALTERLRKMLRTSDCLARLGGDEFALLAPELTVTSAERLAERIRAALSEPLDLGVGVTVSVEASVGIAFLANARETVDELLARAEEATHQAKHQRLGWLFYDPEQHRAARRAAKLAQELRGALKDGQLVVRYQPVRDLRRRRWAGTEALVRWQHPEDGQLAPDEFILLAESRGLIREVDGYVLDRAVAACSGRRGWLAVNVSPHTLADPGWATFVGDTLARHRFAPRRLVLEVTERVILDLDRVQPVMRELQALGVRIALDDFGTGYSSLGYLTELPVHFIKVDKSLVRNVAEHPRNAMVVESILVLARHLGLEVVAEGIEQEAERRWLLANGCRYAQGFALARPAPLDAAPSADPS